MVSRANTRRRSPAATRLGSRAARLHERQLGAGRAGPRRASRTNNPASGGARIETFTSRRPVLPEHPQPPRHRQVGAEHLQTARCGRRRASSPAWASESMIDELAHAANMDALAFRRAHMTHDAWLARCSTRSATAANWQPRVSASQALERAVRDRPRASRSPARTMRTTTSTPASWPRSRSTARRARSSVKHLYGAQDSGFVVNPASVENQIIGMLIRGVEPDALRGGRRSRRSGSRASTGSPIRSCASRSTRR